MPTKREREYYSMGFMDGLVAERQGLGAKGIRPLSYQESYREIAAIPRQSATRKPKRKLSAWNKFVKANSKKPRFRLRSGKLNLKKLGVAFRKTPAGRKRKK